MTFPLVPNQELSTQGPTVFKTERNQHEVRCGTCGRIIYVEEEKTKRHGVKHDASVSKEVLK